ncbi:primosomal protein DnaI [Priestia koreensis]|uniref:primosomal protein DnaI n=1 Tax=Priestia koreensis TaxID=284581 RepID=UPI001F5958A4|nr:primosomal protein DnaI [Priestia koreensis]MCM3002761.1 primosomal protein DnaI [Priestia koreensis]UNL84457.1 primosomal protein DnaI [Priestia koreensis]
MRPLNDSLREFANKGDFQKRFQEMKKKVMADARVQAFLRENEDRVTAEMIDRSLIKLYEYTTQSKQCEQCPSLGQCINMIEGYHPQLIIQGKTIDLQYERCPKKVREDQMQEQQAFIQSLYVPKDILRASMAEIEVEHGRIEAIKLAHQFLREYEPGKQVKGLYIHGPFGVGKTYLLGAIANELADKQVRSLIVYVPEFLRELKGSFQDQSVNEKVEFVKKAPVLMLDDLGAESVTSWMRDDILGTILQFRMLENLPTFFASNLDWKQLEHHFTYTQRGEQEALKAARIMERIRALTTPTEVTGKNRRY